jgi:transcription initiation factor TFIIIB Brf1 subunit/transcription initiation factor TFIIB
MGIIYFDASKCTECGSENIGFNEQRAEFFCRDCGFVLMDNLPVVEAQHGKIEKVLVNKNTKRIAVMIKGILRSPIEKKMVPFYAEIKKFALPKYIEAEVLTLARSAVEKKLTMSFSKIEILSSLIYHTCKRENIPVLIKDLEKTYSIGKKRILKCNNLLIDRLGLKRINEINVENYIIRIVSDLGFNCNLAAESIQISNKIKIDHPLIRAAVSIWLAGKRLKLRIKKKDLAKLSGISEAALRRNIKRKL